MKLLSVSLAFTLLFLAIGCRNSVSHSDEQLPNLPEPQKQFCKIVAQSDPQKMVDEVRTLLGPSGGAFVAWRGQGEIRDLANNTLGITFKPCINSGNSISLETGKIQNGNTSVPTGSSYANSLQTLDFSAGMIVTGKFLLNPPALNENATSFIVHFDMFSPTQFNGFRQSAAVADNHAKAPLAALSTLRPSPHPVSSQTRSSQSNHSETQLTPSATRSTARSGLTDQQIQLCKLNDDFLNWQPPPQDTNPIKIATAPPIQEPDWNGRLQNILGDGTFTNWRGTLYSFLVNEYQEISILVYFSCSGGENNLGFSIDLSTNPVDRTPWPHVRSKIPPTDPKIGSEISNFLSTMKPRDLVTVSGKIFYERRYLEHPLFLTTYLSLHDGRSNYAAKGLTVRFDRMSR